MPPEEPSAIEGPKPRTAKGLYEAVLHSRHSDLYLALVLLAIATIPRVFYISRDIQPNGVDEGIQIMVGRMAGAGYDLFGQLKPMQTPLIFSFYALIEADPVVFRIFSTLSSLIIMVCVMWVGYRIGGRYMMVATGAFMAMDLMFLHESRFASLDMFCLLWVVLGAIFLVKFRQSGSKWSLVLMGVFFGISAMIKLFGTIAAGAAGLILLIDLLSELGPLKRYNIQRFLPHRRVHRVRLSHIILFSLAFTLLTLVVMARFGFYDVIKGAFLDQMHRPVIPFTNKLRYFGVFLLMNALHIPFMFIGFKPLYRRPEGVVLFMGAVYLLFFMFQSTTWVHHLIFLSPVISLSAGVGLVRASELVHRVRSKRLTRAQRRRFRRTVIYVQVTMVLIAAVIGGAFSLMVKQRGESAQRQVASLLEDLTDSDDFVISGDPLIPAIADRPVPPNVVNVASVQYPDLTDDELNWTVISYGVEVVILSYHLNDMEGFRSFVEENFRLRAHYIDKDLPLSKNTVEYWVYELPKGSDLRDDPLWGTQHLPEKEGDDDEPFFPV